MKVKEVFDAALALMAEESPDAYSHMVVHAINQTMAQCRYLTDKETITRVTSQDSEIDFPEDLVLECFPPALCVYFLLSDDELQKASFFDAMYKDAQNSYGSTKSKLTDVSDVYGGEPYA